MSRPKDLNGEALTANTINNIINDPEFLFMKKIIVKNSERYFTTVNGRSVEVRELKIILGDKYKFRCPCEQYGVFSLLFENGSIDYHNNGNPIMYLAQNPNTPTHIITTDLSSDGDAANIDIIRIKPEILQREIKNYISKNGVHGILI